MFGRQTARAGVFVLISQPRARGLCPGQSSKESKSVIIVCSPLRAELGGKVDGTVVVGKLVGYLDGLGVS